jgi:hypothetical protein
MPNFSKNISKCNKYHIIFNTIIKVNKPNFMIHFLNMLYLQFIYYFINSFKAYFSYIILMNTRDNMLLTDSATSSNIINKGFDILDATFKEKGWHLIKNEINWITYTKFGDESTFFDIKILPETIIVSVPIKNSSYQYVTSFKGYYEASEYVEQKLLVYNE